MRVRVLQCGDGGACQHSCAVWWVVCGGIRLRALFVLPPSFLPASRYNEIAELVVAAAQRRALQQRAEQQGVPLMPGDAGVLKV